jgi:hypothetical protein
MHVIFMWGLVSATVGILLRLLESVAQRMGSAGRIIWSIIISILGLAWSIMTIFVVPVMVYKDVGPMEAIQKSVKTLKRTWGESLVRYYGMGFAQFILLIIGFIIGIPLAILAAQAAPLLGFLLIGVLIAYLIVIVLLFSVANTIFNTSLYVYADTGKLPTGYDKGLLDNAFQRR